MLKYLCTSTMRVPRQHPATQYFGATVQKAVILTAANSSMQSY